MNQAKNQTQLALDDVRRCTKCDMDVNACRGKCTLPITMPEHLRFLLGYSECEDGPSRTVTSTGDMTEAAEMQ